MPRPSVRPSGAIWRLLEQWSAEHPLNPNQRQMANLLEVSDSLLTAWKLRQSVIQTEDIDFIAKATGISRKQLEAAAIEDKPEALLFVQARRAGAHGRKKRRGSAET